MRRLPESGTFIPDDSVTPRHLTALPSEAKFSDPLDASSCFQPGGGQSYAPLREKVIATAMAMVYDPSVFTEHAVGWFDDLDPFQNVKGCVYPKYVFQCNFRLIESFAQILKDKWNDAVRVHGKGLSVMSKTFAMDLKRQVFYPDALLTAVRITSVGPDRCKTITTVWSLRQQAIVAECIGGVVFFDYSKQRPGNLVEYGGVYAELHADLLRRADESNKAYEEWAKANPKAVSKRSKL